MRYPPMLATLGDLPERGEWLTEWKWDGIRACITVSSAGRLLIESRAGRDKTASFPELAGLVDVVAPGTVLDGELVTLDAAGKPSFERLQNRMHVQRPSAALQAEFPVALFAFDLLVDAGVECLAEPLVDRRARLAEALPTSRTWLVPPAFDADPADIYAAAEQQGLEGVVCKKPDGVYRPGKRSPGWIKVKITERDEYVVGGWLGGEGSRAGTIGSLVIGRPSGGGLRYCGRVGSGLTDATIGYLRSVLRATGESPFVDAPAPPGTLFVAPEVVVSVEHRGVTSAGVLRAPAFKGVREDVMPADLSEEES